MHNVKITNGVIKYGRTVKTGEFESKRGDVELSFTIEEGTDADAAISYVERKAIGHVFDILGVQEDNRKPVAKAPAAAEAGEAAPAAKKAAPAKKMPKAEVADPSAVEEEMETPPILQSAEERAAKKAAKAPVAAADVVEEEDDELGDIMGTEPKVAKEITDKELTDATQKCQSTNKNAPAIRKAMKESGGIVSPPGRLIDIPQAKRQSYLDALKEIKPLA